MPRVTLPLPPDELKVNASKGRHWAEIERVKEEYHVKAHPDIKAQRGQWDGVRVHWPVHLWITVYLGNTESGRPKLADTSDVGAWCKFPLDLLVKAGAFPDDNAKRLNPVTAVVRWDAAHPRLVFEWDATPPDPTPADALAAALAEKGARMTKVRRRVADG